MEAKYFFYMHSGVESDKIYNFFSNTMALVSNFIVKTFLDKNIFSYMQFPMVEKSRICAPNSEYPHCAYAKKMMKNMTQKPATSFAQVISVLDNSAIVWLKLMYLNTYRI